jgi:hypothetical protein
VKVDDERKGFGRREEREGREEETHSGAMGRVEGDVLRKHGGG